MSGGHWNFSGYTIESMLSNIGEDGEVIKRFPELSKILIRLGEALCDIEHDLDCDLSGDSHIKDDAEFEQVSINKLREILSVKNEIKDIEDDLITLEKRFQKIKSGLVNKYKKEKI
jgi:hypothetical protein